MSVLALVVGGVVVSAPAAASAAGGVHADLATLTQTPSPTIVGTPAVGSVLSASTGTWGPGSVTFAFKWFAADVAIAGATASTYTPVVGDIGKKITLTVTGSESGYTSVSKSSGATTSVVAGTFTQTPSPTISGSPVVGSPLTANTGTWLPGPVSFAFKWYAANVAIAGATASTYTPVSADLGKKITLTITGSRSGFTSVSKSSGATTSVTAPAGITPPQTPTSIEIDNYNVVTPTAAFFIYSITAGAYPGFSESQISYVYDLNGNGVWLPLERFDGLAYSPYVLSDGTNLPLVARQNVVAGNSYTVRIKERATVNGVFYDSAPTASSESLRARGLFDLGYQIQKTISGDTVTFSWDLSQALNGWQPPIYLESSLGDSEYWTVSHSGDGIVGSQSYTVGYNSTIDFFLYGIMGDDGPGWYATATTGADPGASLPLTSTPLPTIVGTASVGASITARPGTWQPAPVSLGYQWNRNGTPVPGATGVSYNVTAADAGYQLSVTVTGSKTGYTSKSVTSAPTARVPSATITSVVPTITGTAKFGQTLTASAGTWGPGVVSLAYRWARNGVTIPGATAKTYKLVAADVGTQVTVTVTGTKSGYASVSQTSAATQVVAALPLTAAPVPTITGTAVVGGTLTAKPGTYSPAPVTLTYQWKRGGVAITGATGVTYKPVAADKGKQLTVTVTGTKAGYTTSVKTSTPTTIP